MTGKIGQFALVLVAAGMVAGCEGGFRPFGNKSDTASEATPTTATATQSRSVKLVDRDVEAPEVFQVTDTALWDGRPSLGGVWVASPDAGSPERVIIRNPANGKFVIGALFRRERDNPGPKLQISSDAAAALGLLAGQPARVSVTALRRQEVAAEPDTSKPILDANEGVKATPLDAAAATAPATAALNRADAAKPAAPPAPAPTAPAAAAPAPKPAAPAAAPTGSLIQIGIFSVEANAKRASDTLSKAGIQTSTRTETSQGKTFWSVTTRGNAAQLAKVKAAGFADAYVMKR